MNELNWSDVAELREWLTAAAIPIRTWGHNGAKTVAALWQELLAGESVLQTNPPQRQVQVVEIIIRRGDQILIEAAQELANGQVRRRGILPAEKMKAGEGVKTAVWRGLGEELGVHREDVIFLPDSYQQRQSCHDSPSYPGLPTLYTIHSLAVQVAGLPEGEFWHDNEAYGPGDPVKRHYWAWRPGADSSGHGIPGAL